MEIVSRATGRHEIAWCSVERSDTSPTIQDGGGWLDLAILIAVSTGAETAEIVASLGEAAPGRDDVLARLTALERAGLLQTLSGGMTVTAAGRQVLRVGAMHLAASARALEEERRQVERLRTDLLETISHELRTPLTLIRTSIGLLLDSEPEEEMRLRLLRNIKQSTERMHHLVADLLDLARMRGDRLELQLRGVDLGELVAGTVALMRPLLDAKDQRVELALPARPLTVPGDPRRLERVLLNLLSNANNFAPPGSTIDVAVRNEGAEAIIAVRDHGPGISEEAMPHLFDQFFTARTSSTRHNIGVGLGLPIAKGVVEAHGGRIWVESAVGAGTTVSFALPSAWPREGSDEDPGR